MTLVLLSPRILDDITPILEQYPLTKIIALDSATHIIDYANTKSITIETIPALTDDLIKSMHQILYIWTGSPYDTAIKEIKHLETLNKVTSFQHINTTISLTNAKAKPITDLFNIVGTDQYTILRNLNKEHTTTTTLEHLHNVTIYTPHKETRLAVTAFLQDQLYLSIENQEKHTPMIQGLFHLGLDLGMSRMTAFAIHKRVASFNMADLELIDTPDVTTLNILQDPLLDQGAKIIEDTLKDEYRVCMVTDSDADGTDSCALGFRYFKSKFASSVFVCINERRHGNGVNSHLVDLITEDYYNNPTGTYLIITADHGSANETAYQELKALGDNIKIIVTDHHILPRTGRPTTCDVHINPQDPVSTLPPYISGCTVLYALLLRHQILYHQGDLKSLDYLIPYVGITVISDMMDVSKPVNRYLWKTTVREITNSDFGTWVLFREIVDTNMYLTDTFSRGFIPYINACNRMGDATLAFKLLTTSNIINARKVFQQVEKLNNSRKSIQKSLTRIIPLGIDSKYSVSHVLDTSGLRANQIEHASGVIGIVANNIGDRYGKPCFIFIKEGNVLKGSGRGIAKNISIKRAIDHVATNMPKMFLKGGGHKGAGGLALVYTPVTIELFNHYMDESILAQSNGVLLTVNHQDITLPLDRVNLDYITNLSKLSPMGMGFEPIVVTTQGTITGLRIMGIMGTFQLYDESGYSIKVLTFQADNISHLREGDHHTVTGEVNIDQFTGRTTMFI